MKMPKTNRTEEVPNMDLSSGFFYKKKEMREQGQINDSPELNSIHQVDERGISSSIFSTGFIGCSPSWHLSCCFSVSS